MDWLALLISLSSLATVLFFYWRFRRRDEFSTENLSNRIGGLLSEFNEVSSEKVELLDDRTEELRRVVELADMKRKKLERLIDRAEGLTKRLQATSQKQDSPPGSDEIRSQVLTMAEEGYEVTQIAEETGLKPGEVSVLIKVNRRESRSQ